MSQQSKLFASLLKYWRNKRGLSQLELALKSDVSARHISFLETGRSQPSEEMVLRITETLDLPLRERNQLLRDSGFEPVFPEPELSVLDEPGTRKVISLMMERQEPYPLVVMDRWYNILQTNQSAQLFLQACFKDRPEQFPEPPINAVLALFRDDQLRPNILNWEPTARLLLARLHRELLHRPNDDRLSTLLEEVLALPGVPEDWHTPDPSLGNIAVFPFGFEASGRKLEFVTTLTVFSTPQYVTLQELQLESYFPLNQETEERWLELRNLLLQGRL